MKIIANYFRFIFLSVSYLKPQRAEKDGKRWSVIYW